MYKVTFNNCYSNECWVFEDYETASLFVKMAIDSGSADLEAKITRVWEGLQDESL